MSAWRNLGVKLALALLLLALGAYAVGSLRNTYATKELVTSKPLVTGLATEVKVLPVVVAKKASAESRLRVELPVGHSVTATAELRPSETGYGVLSVIDENTGVSTLQQYEKPRNFIGFPMTGRIKAGAGIGTAGSTIKGGVEFTPLRVQDVYLTVEAEARLSSFGRTEAYTGVLIEYRF